ncbi:phage tail protein [Chryseobacterium taichungense]|uniref:phage tail protein n=1 Tax=Chryseobacterium taichungense TaxID=295069 RepID=UPI0028AFCF96|nr:phage tail protein [Chryseobacterium taichungense]
MKSIITLAVLFISLTIFAQVGINNTSPQATLDITAKTTGNTTAEGLIAPRLEGIDIKGKDGKYDIAQKGAIVYALSAVASPSVKTANITAEGYYYFDGSIWQKVSIGNTLHTTLNSGNIFVGNASNVATAVAPTGDVTIDNAGVTSIGIGKVTNSQLATVSTGTGGIYKGSGSLAGNTIVAQDANTLAFTSTATTGTSHFTVDGSTFNINALGNNVGIGTNTPNTNAALDISSTTKGVKLPSLALTATNSVVPGLYTNDGTQWILLQTPQTVNVSAPAGTVSYTAASTVPAGYLECNGTAVSRTTYATLFAAIGTTYGAGDGSTTFNLPDLRGEFVRGWDHGRGVDASRSLGSTQTNSTKLPNANFTGTTSSYTHNHSVGDGSNSANAVNAGSYGLLRRSVSGESNTPGGGDSYGSGNEPDAYSTPRVIPNDSHSHTVTVAGGGDSETRPRNISLMPIIKF